MYVSALAVVLLRFSRLKLSLLVLALASLLLPLAEHSSAQTFTSSSGIAVSGTQAASVGSTVSVSGLSSTVTGMSLTFNGLSVSNLNDVAIVLVPPSGSGLTPLDLFSGICGYGSEQIGSSTFTLADSNATGSDNFSGMLPYLGGTCPATLSGTYLPSDYFPGQDAFNSPGPSTYNSGGPGSSVCAPLNVTCGNYGFATGFGLPSSPTNLNGTWTLYIANQVSPPYATPSGSLSSWSLTFTTASATATTTTISSNLHGVSSAVFTNTDVNGDPTTGTAVTFTASVSPIPTGGTIAFFDSTGTTAGSGILLASGALVNGLGQAQAVVTFPGAEEGSRSITAVYSGVPNAYTASTTTAPATVVTVNHPYNPSGATFCNGPIKLNDDNGGSPYPSLLVLGNSFAQLQGTIESVSVTLNGISLQNGVALDDLGVMLQAPGVTGTQTLSEGNAFQFLSWAGNPFNSGTLTFSDSGTAEIPPFSSPSCTTCLPTDDHIDIGTSNPDTYPAPAPATFVTAAPTGTGTFLTEFGGLNANGTWSLFLDNRLTEGGALGSIASWCVNFTVQANAHPTAMAASGSPNPATFAGSNTTATVSLVANVTTTDSSGTVTAGSVTFMDGSTNLGIANVVNGQATLSVSLTEGTHQIVASYSGTSTGTVFGISSQAFDVRVNKATTSSGSGAGPYAFCNSGPITAPGLSDDAGAAYPYPSNIQVSNLPGTVNSMSVMFNGFSTKDQGDLLSLLVGPGGNNLDFFSLTGSNVSTPPSPFNIAFGDGGSSIGGNLSSSGTYAPASYNSSIPYPQCPPNAIDCGTENVGPPLGTHPTFTPTNKAASAGTAILGNASAAGVFGGTSSSTYNGNGTWSLYIDDGGPTGGGETTNMNGGWCLNFSVNLPTISFSGPVASTFVQGGAGSLPAVTITNDGINGAGSIGDPAQSIANAMTLTDTLPTGLTYAGFSGTDWTCPTPSGQTAVTCTNEDTVAVNSSFAPLTIDVNVSNSLSGPIGNNTVAVSDTQASNTPASQSGSVFIDAPAALTSPAPGSVLAGSNVTFTWTTGTGVTDYDLWLGTSGPGSSSLYASGLTTATSVTVTSLPSKGATVYARLYSIINGVDHYTDYTYTEAAAAGTPATMISPTSGSTLGTSNQIFTWTTGTGATEYNLWLGLSGPGSSSLYASGWLTTMSTTVPSLPAKGATVYARLYSMVNGAAQYNDYTYTESPAGAPAAMISPTPGSVLGTSNVKFTWTMGTGATEYNLWLGLSGPGSSSLYASGWLTTTSSTVASLPAKAATVYARLYSMVNGAVEYNDYTYTEAGTPATMISPTAGSTLGTSNVKFTWTMGIGATEYNLWLGLSGPGSSSLYASGWLTTTSTTVTSLPAKGATVYARLYSMVNGAVEYNDYTYTESPAGTPAAMISPMGGSTLGTSNVQFTWTTGTGATEYNLWLGLSGPGSSSLYASGWLTTTSTTVTSLPAKGATVYARLYSMVNGAVEYNDYTYIEQ
jgi:hypothetical protein